MPTVWVTQETDHDIRSAEKWGEIRFVAGRDFLSIKDSQVNGDLLERIQAAAIEFDPFFDWILITGSPYLAVMFVAHLTALYGNNNPYVSGATMHEFKFLRWSNRDAQYYPLELPFPK